MTEHDIIIEKYIMAWEREKSKQNLQNKERKNP
jgi:hypothetical protein